jgi:hypothetical protein
METAARPMQQIGGPIMVTLTGQFLMAVLAIVLMLLFGLWMLPIPGIGN